MDTPDQTLEVWRAFESLYHSGLVKSKLGVSNIYDIRLLEELWHFAKVKPTIVQNRFYEATNFDQQIRDFCTAHGIAYQSFWTLTANRKALIHPWMQRIAQAHYLTPAQLLFKFVLQLGIQPLSGTTDPVHMRQDLATADAPMLAALEVDTIAFILRGIA
jgi:diketogulonate reductase-like aldo/keto reductase